jgi:hypothetical protein
MLAGGCAAWQTQQMSPQHETAIPSGAKPSTPQAARQREAAIPHSAVKMTPKTDTAPPVLHFDEWQNPIPIPGTVNTAGAEDSPFITPDGSTLYFFFTPDLSVPPEKQLLDGVTGIYVSRLQGSAWGQVERVLLQTPDKLALDGCPFVQTTTLWFCSAREGYTGIHFYIAQFLDNKWSNWQSADNQFKPGYEVGELHITADGQELYFHSPRPGGQGQLDIWVTRLANGVWQTPENVAAVNSPETEGWPFVSQDRNELWFTRMYLGSPAIYRSLWTGSAWAEPELVISQFAGEPTLDNQGNLYFVHHFIREGKMVEADLYVAYRR